MPAATPRRRLASLHAHLCPAAATAPPLPSWYAEADSYEDTLDAVAMDPTAWVANRLTAAQREQFDKDGYLCAPHPIPLPRPIPPPHHLRRSRARSSRRAEACAQLAARGGLRSAQACRRGVRAVAEGEEVVSHPIISPARPCRGRIILDALPAVEFAAVSKALDDLRELRESQGLPPNKSVLDPVFSASHSLWEEPAVVRMLKAPKVLPKVVDIMGWNVYLYHGHLTVDPPFRDGPTVPPESEQNPFGYHQDSGRVNQELGECSSPLCVFFRPQKAAASVRSDARFTRAET